MFDKSQAGPNGKAKAVEVTRYPMGSTLICELMPKLLEAVHADRALMGALFQVNFLTTLSGEVSRPLAGRRRTRVCVQTRSLWVHSCKVNTCGGVCSEVEDINGPALCLCQALITMIYHRKLDADWEAAAGRMREKLKVRGGEPPAAHQSESNVRHPNAESPRAALSASCVRAGARDRRPQQEAAAGERD